MDENRLLMNPLTARELGALAKSGILPGMPTDSGNIHKKARREMWTRQPRSGRGGGFLYFPPEPWRAILALRECRLGQAQPSAEVAAVSVKTAKDQAAAIRRDARLHILYMHDRFLGETALPAKVSTPLFTLLYKTPEASLGSYRPLMEIPDWVRAVKPKVSASTLNNWRALRDQGNTEALAGNYGNRRYSGIIDTNPELQKFVILGILKNLTCSQILESIPAEMRGGQDHSGKPIRLRSLQRWVAWYKKTYVKETIQ